MFRDRVWHGWLLGVAQMFLCRALEGTAADQWYVGAAIGLAVGYTLTKLEKPQ